MRPGRGHNNNNNYNNEPICYAKVKQFSSALLLHRQADVERFELRRKCLDRMDDVSLRSVGL